jgi:hypothetical protein
VEHPRRFRQGCRGARRLPRRSWITSIGGAASRPA